MSKKADVQASESQKKSAMQDVSRWAVDVYVNWWLAAAFFIGLALFGGACFWEWHEVWKVCEQGYVDSDKQCGLGLTEGAVVEFVKQIGTALAVTSVLMWFLDARFKRVQREDEAKFRELVWEENKEYRQSLNEDVLNVVLGTQMPESLVQQVMKSVFGRSVIREKISLHYTMREITPDNLGEVLGFADKPLDSKEVKSLQQRLNQDDYKKYIVVDVETISWLKNVTIGRVEEVIRSIVPKTSHPHLKEYSRVETWTVGDNEIIKNGERLDGVKKAGKKGGDDCSAFEEEYEKIAHIEPDSKLKTVNNYKLIKERSDAETYTTLYPAESLRLTVDMRELDGIEWEVDGLHSGKIDPENIKDEGPYGKRRVVFKSNEPLLPYQGTSTYWRPLFNEEKKKGGGKKEG